MKPKALVFYQYLPPWRIDVFNEMAKYYELTIVFTDANREGFTYDRDGLLNKLTNIETIFLTSGFYIGKRPIRLGIYKLIKQVKPDVIFSHEYSPTSVLVALYRQLRLFKYKYYLTTSDNVEMARASKGIKAKSREYVLNHSDGIIVYSEGVKKWYQQHFPKLRIEICPNIQNPKTLLAYRSEFTPIIKQYVEQFNLQDTNVLLYTGRLTEVKGLDLLLKAFAKANIDNYKLVIVGNGELEQDLKQLSIDLSISEKVVFAGFYSGINLYAWYDMANLFVLPSRYEPFGAVVNEALIYGCPVVASKYIGALDFIDDSNGVVFDPLNETEFIETLQITCDKYGSTTIGSHSNLIIQSFEKYVVAFKNISF